jgi:hypothetical protein
MATEIPGVAERLAREFADVPPRAVMEAVCSCAGEWGEGVSPLFVEQAARARLFRQRDPLTDGRSAPASLPGSPG